MKITSQHIEALKRARPYMDAIEAVNALVDDSVTYNSYSNACNEIEARLADKRAQEADVDGRLAAVAQKEEAAQAVLQAAKDKADDILSDAHRTADKIKEDAEGVADGIIDRAKAQVKVNKDAANKELADISDLTDKKREEFTQLADATDAKQKELDGFTGQIEAARATITKMLQG